MSEPTKPVAALPFPQAAHQSDEATSADVHHESQNAIGHTTTPDDANPHVVRPPSSARRDARDNDIMLPGIAQQTMVPGSRLGNPYVRRRLPNTREFRQRDERTIEATEHTLAPRSPIGQVAERVKRVFIGGRLATSQQEHERLTKVKALAVLSSDAISSVAYATEASLGILIAAGLGVLSINLLLAAAIAMLMMIVGTSYWQTIHAYPHGGGSYIVARDNMGDWAGLVAAAALLIDYVLTVSVSVSSGVDALTSAVKPLAPYDVVLGVFFILVIMAVNLRGIRESGTIFAAPTYLFIGAFLVMIVTGVIHAVLLPGGLFHALPPKPVNIQTELGWEPQKLSLLLILTAFASGCSAMTGVEAISNGVPAFQKPESHNAAKTLVWMIGILVTLFLGVTYLAWRFGVTPNAHQNPTLDSKIASLLFVGPFAWFYYVVQFATLLILVLAANTSYADFPRLASILARDRFLPHQFSFRGDRLAFTTGIVVLSILSILLLVIFKGSTDALINLYALGVFTAFTLSQSGMVVRWFRLRDTAGAGWRRSLAINLVGAIVTGIVAAIIMVTKFERGAWIVVLLVPLFVLLFRGIARHYATVQRQTEALTPLKAEDLRHIMLVPIADLNRPALQSLAYARSLTAHVLALHISTDGEEEAAFRARWDSWMTSRTEDLLRESSDGRTAGLLEQRTQLVVIQSPYRALVAPLVAYIDAIRDANPGTTVSVILPEFVPAHWWERLLHNQTALRLKLALYTDPGVVVVNVPHLLRRR